MCWCDVPQCGHFSLIIMYKIAAFKEGRDHVGEIIQVIGQDDVVVAILG